jgi:putative tricarboxylic transport membrane protein
MDLYSLMEIVFSWQNILALIFGSLFGIIIGALPGIGPSAGMALMFPLILNWNPVTGLIFMGTLYRASNYHCHHVERPG